MKSMTIIEESRTGMLAEITTLLEGHDVNVRSIDGNTVGAMAVINLSADPYETTLKILSDAGFKVFQNEQILLRVPDRPGALADISRQLANREVDIRSVHIVGREGEECILAIETDNDYCARQVLRKMLVR
ncbi:MAG: ACT domain-containing protein [Xanthomonadales bacterium]|nr:ACT domain-containing protein [Xanthomonadales bacterium]